MASAKTTFQRKRRGFEHASHLMQKDIRKAGETRGFAVTRLLTHWAEIVGDQTAKMARPVKVSYGREGLGATLTVLTTGAQAPMLQADLPKIKDRVNACYGYAAIARIRITQTAPTGFAEGQVAFDHRPPAPTRPDAASESRARDLALGVADDNLRHALEALGANVYARSTVKKD